jgi:chromosome segregation protein
VYLKSIEIVGFKSFAHPTLLRFEPGMTAIVGPNGCGKSNIADAIRWVLGETSAKALRGSKMEDVIFNGTEARKPLGMSEVSITFADCEKTLGTDYNEVTVTRRVFRSGEGQYFLNKTACRLKDIARLFMDTGIGTSSYSLMEQGRIDQVLSSRPEDRREIFEEASGITRFKADRKEALRKLEQTEANLLRLDDVIREVKRQIGSLQRQAGKARRYKELRDQLRKLDTFWAARRLQEMDVELQTLETTIAELNRKIQLMQEDTQKAAQQEGALRSALAENEQAIAQATEDRAAAQTRLEHNHDLIRINRERVQELLNLAERDKHDSTLAQTQAEQQRQSLEEIVATLARIQGARDTAEQDWKQKNDTLLAHEALVEKTRHTIQDLRQQAMTRDHTIATLQNQLGQIEARQQATLVRRERLAAEHAQIARVANENEAQLGRIAEHLGTLQEELERRENRATELQERRQQQTGELETLRRQSAESHSQIAVKKAQIEILEADEQSAKDFPEGARLILDAANPLGLNAQSVLGALASHLQIAAEHRLALEAVLRAWLDAVVLADAPDALAALTALHQRKGGPARILTVQAADAMPAPAPVPAGSRRLLELVQSTPFVRPLIERLLANVFVVETPDAIPAVVPAASIVVTRSGIVAHSSGAFEYWTADARASNPLTRRLQLADLHESLDALEGEVENRTQALRNSAEMAQRLDADIQDTGRLLTEQRRAVALKEGEYQIVSKEVRQAKERLGVVGFELENLTKQVGLDDERQGIAVKMDEARTQQAESHARIESLTRELQEMERKRAGLQAEATEARVAFSEARQQAEHLSGQQEPLKRRLVELASVIKSRSEGVVQYEKTIAQLTQATTAAEAQLSALEASAAGYAKTLDTLRQGRTEKAKQLALLESDITGRREAADDLREERGQSDVKLAEGRMRRQNLADRVTADWSATLEEIAAAPEPEWEGEQPIDGPIPYEKAIADLRGKIDAMGAVNLVAIEEYQELEERYAFLTSQQSDLINAKQQLLEMIRKINQTTAELFSVTFAKINENFQIMYERLFNGGSAKLVMVSEDDILESGIDIVARPPGKRLQSVSLLSGGERTMTAVALLFSIYMIKPSPFCMLDELDAALDESNIGRFVKVLADFLKQSQFIVITHNRRTIASADTIYGVTMQETGISKVVSMKFAEYEQNKDMQAAARRGAPPPPAPAPTG